MEEIISRSIFSGLKFLIKCYFLIFGCLYYYITYALSHKHHQKNVRITTFLHILFITFYPNNYFSIRVNFVLPNRSFMWNGVIASGFVTPEINV